MDFVYCKNLKVDVYIPNKKDFITIVNFHGGGLVEGSRSSENLVEICSRLKQQGFCVFNFDYSLYPNAKFPEFIEDAALAVKTALNKSKELGGSGKIFVMGESAGAYLTAMLYANHKYLLDVGVDPHSITGWICESGQMTDHFHVLEYEFKKDSDLEIITECAPLFYIKEGFNGSPLLLVVYDNDMKNRLKQNMMMKEALERNTNSKVQLSILKGTHCRGSSVIDPDGEYGLIKEINKFLLKDFK